FSPLQDTSPLCQKQSQKFLEQKGHIQVVQSVDDIVLPEDTLFIDGIFGTGFQGEVREPYASVIEAVNLTKRPVIAVDLPSGLDGETGKVEGVAIRAVETAFLGLPKRGFFLERAFDYTGVLRPVDFGLGKEFVEQAAFDVLLLTSDMVRPFLPLIR